MILIALFQQSAAAPVTWDMVRVGHVIVVDNKTWPGKDYYGYPDPPVALGLVTISCTDSVWRAECEHPDGHEVAVAGFMDKDEALEALREAVRGR